MSLMKWDKPEPLTPSIPPLHFHFLFLKTSPPHIYLFLTKIHPPLSGQISDEIWYTWWHLALTIYPNGHSQN